MIKKVLAIGLIVILALGNIYFYNESKKVDYSILLGTPSGSGNEIERIDFSEPIKDKEEARIIIFTLMDGYTVENPKVCENIPDSSIWFNDWNEGVSYNRVDIWKDGNSIILRTNANSETPEYRKINDGRANEIIKLIEKYKK